MRERGGGCQELGGGENGELLIHEHEVSVQRNEDASEIYCTNCTYGPQ